MCKTEKIVEQFAAKAKSKDGLQPQCRECQRSYRKAHYEANRSKYIQKARVWNVANQQYNREMLISYFSTHPCVDCQENDMELLEFDHRDPSLKEFNVCSQTHSKNWPALLAEIEKCDVRCVVCHRRKTNRQFGYWRTALQSAGTSGANPE